VPVAVVGGAVVAAGLLGAVISSAAPPRVAATPVARRAERSGPWSCRDIR